MQTGSYFFPLVDTFSSLMFKENSILISEDEIELAEEDPEEEEEEEEECLDEHSHVIAAEGVTLGELVETEEREIEENVNISPEGELSIAMV